MCVVILKTETRATDDLFILLQEKVDRTASSNPDLHLNRATVKKKYYHLCWEVVISRLNK